MLLPSPAGDIYTIMLGDLRQGDPHFGNCAVDYCDAQARPRKSTLDHDLKQLRKIAVFTFGANWEEKDNPGHEKQMLECFLI